MRNIKLYSICLLVCAALSLPLWGQQGSDALTGSWVGDWGPSARDRNQVTVEFKLAGNALTGTVNPGPNAIPFEKSSFDPKTGVVTLEAVAQNASGAKIRYIVEGKLENNVISGSWNHENRKGDFKITKK